MLEHSRLDLQMPGRLWEGKEALLTALAALAKACSTALETSASSRLVAALVEATGEQLSV